MKHPVKVLTFALLAASYAGTAYADECATDEDCPTGFACESWASDCAEAPPCPPGEECPEPEPCDEEEYSECVPSPTACETNADCSDEWECVTFTYEDCWGEDTPEPMPAPDEPGSGGSDDDPDGEGHEEGDREDPEGSFECETVSESYCAPPYVAPCETDSDCGEGFGCVEIEECSCGGSSGSGSSGSSGGSSDPMPLPPGEDSGGEDSGGEDSGGSGGDPDGEPDHGEGDEDWPDGEPDCECTGSGQFYCEPLDIDCEADSDCPDEWTCESWGISTSAPCYEDEDGNVICEDEGTTEEYSQCEPPGWGAWGGAAGGGSDGDLAGGPSRATAEESANDDAGESDIPFAAAPTEEEGCSSSSTAPRGAGLLALLALVGLRRRR